MDHQAAERRITFCRATLLAASLLGLTGVALGAWAAHGLADTLGPAKATRLPSFETGVRYQMSHAGVLLAVAMLPASKRRATAAGLLIAGTLVFSGSLYILVTSGVPKWGAVTPIGGVLLLAGWSCLVALAIRPPAGEQTMNDAMGVP